MQGVEELHGELLGREGDGVHAAAGGAGGEVDGFEQMAFAAARRAMDEQRRETPGVVGQVTGGLRGETIGRAEREGLERACGGARGGLRGRGGARFRGHDCRAGDRCGKAGAPRADEMGPAACSGAARRGCG